MYGHRNVFTVSLALATLAVLSLGCKTGAASGLQCAKSYLPGLAPFTQENR